MTAKLRRSAALLASLPAADVRWIMDRLDEEQHERLRPYREALAATVGRVPVPGLWHRLLVRQDSALPPELPANTAVTAALFPALCQHPPEVILAALEALPPGIAALAAAALGLEHSGQITAMPLVDAVSPRMQAALTLLTEVLHERS